MSFSGVKNMTIYYRVSYCIKKDTATYMKEDMVLENCYAFLKKTLPPNRMDFIPEILIERKLPSGNYCSIFSTKTSSISFEDFVSLLYDKVVEQYRKELNET